MSAIWLIYLLGYKQTANDEDDFSKFTADNHCYVFEYDQHTDGRVEKKWSCQNEEDQQNDTNEQ